MSSTHTEQRAESPDQVVSEAGTNPLDILRISTDTYPDILGGGALHAHEMSRLQAELGHDVTLLTSDHGDQSLPRQEQRAGYELRRYRQVARPFGNSLTPGMVRAIWELIAEHDVVHAHSHLYFSTNVAAALARVDTTPLVVTNHGLHSQTAPMPIQKAYAPVARFTFNSADRVLCYTETDRERLRTRGVEAPISVIHNGIDCEQFTPTAAAGDEPQILFVGRLKETKGVEQVLEAFIDLAERVPAATLTVVGEGPLREPLESRVASAGLTDRVTFTGRVENGDLAKIYAESAVFALPSTVEGFPRTVLEAMACGTPVVTSDLPQLESVVEQVGDTVPPADVEALAAALESLLTDETRHQRLGTAARERVCEQFSWTETVQQTTAAYYDLLE